MNYLVEFLKGKVLMVSRVPLILRGIAPGVAPDDATSFKQVEEMVSQASGPDFDVSVIGFYKKPNVAHAPIGPLNIVVERPVEAGVLTVVLDVRISRGKYWGDVSISATSDTEAITFPYGGDTTIPEGDNSTLLSAELSLAASGTHILTVVISNGDLTVEKTLTFTEALSSGYYGGTGLGEDLI